jgi:restriction system protein
MSERTIHFQSPRWRTPSQHHIRASALMLGTLLWLTVYAVLVYRLWVQGIAIDDSLNLVLIAASVLLGGIVLLGWRAAGVSWLATLSPWLGNFKRRALSLEQMYALTPSEFEAYVAERIFARQGYHVLNTRDTKDGGIDILLTDRQGHRAVVQCKRYLGTVGEPVVRDLYGTMINAGATSAYLVTTGGISADARKWAFGKPIELIDGRRLVELAKA